MDHGPSIGCRLCWVRAGTLIHPIKGSVPGPTKHQPERLTTGLPKGKASIGPTVHVSGFIFRTFDDKLPTSITHWSTRHGGGEGTKRACANNEDLNSHGVESNSARWRSMMLISDGCLLFLHLLRVCAGRQVANTSHCLIFTSHGIPVTEQLNRPLRVTRGDTGGLSQTSKHVERR